MKKPLVLIDGSSYLYRAYHALPPLTNSKGEPTGAVYGVINMIKKLIAEYEPEHIAVIFDPKGKTARHEIYPEYKAHRPPMPDELRVQIQPLHDVIRAMGLPLIIVEGIEADDVIGTFAVQAQKQGQHVLISTGDKDMAQLVNPQVELINTMNNVILDEKGVAEKFGVKPNQIIDYLALMGDSSDNVPGVPKVGPKTAVKWLEEFGTLDNIIQHADDFKGKIGENLRASLELLPLSKKLVTIDTNILIPESYQDLKPKEPNNDELRRLFSHLEFKTWLSGLLEKQSVSKKYEVVLTENQLEGWIKKLEASPYFSFDTETTSLDNHLAELVGVSFSVSSGEAAYVPVAHQYSGAPLQLSRNKVLEKLKPLFDNPNKTIVGQNLKYDIGVLDNYHISLKTQLFDTMLESYILSSASNRHDMDTLALKYLGKNTTSFEEIAGKGKTQKTFDQIDLEIAAPYAAEDADITLQLHEKLWPMIVEVKALSEVFQTVEMPTMRVLSRMERTGVLIDSKMLKQQSKELEKRISLLIDEVYTMAGTEFNLASPKQLQEILFEKLQLPVIRKTPTGIPSTGEDVLQELANSYELPKLILEFRTLSKLKSTYTDKLPVQVNAKTGRIHTSYNQAVTATGRLSSTDPNLQNIPIRSEEGRKIRQAFIAPQGSVIVSADYSQVELRIMAHLSKDKTLVAAFSDGHDIHKATAAEVFGVAIDEVTHEQRQRAKAINFGLIYGMSAFGLAKQINVDRDEAQKYIDIYFERYPGVKLYMEKARHDAHQHGYVETVLGRRLYLPEINSSNGLRRKGAERAAINAPMQGTAADLIKLAMIKIDRWIQVEKIPAKMIMQVHDELVFEVDQASIETVKAKVAYLMDTAMALDAPIEVHIGVGSNWDEAH